MMRLSLYFVLHEDRSFEKPMASSCPRVKPAGCQIQSFKSFQACIGRTRLLVEVGNIKFEFHSWQRLCRERILFLYSPYA